MDFYEEVTAESLGGLPIEVKCPTGGVGKEDEEGGEDEREVTEE